MNLFSKFRKLFLFIFILFIFYVFFIPINSFAAYPALVSTLTTAFIKINGYLKAVGAPAAMTAIGTGIFIKKFSFGDEERIRVGKKLIKTSIFSYAFLLCTDMLISAINTVLS